MTLVRKDKTGGFLEVRHYKDLLIQLVTRDLKLKYRRSVLGYVWSVLNPLLIMIVMYVVFSKLFDRNIPNFPVYLLVGRTLYDFVVSSTNKAMDGITSNAALLNVCFQIYVPAFQSNKLYGRLCSVAGSTAYSSDIHGISFLLDNAAVSACYRRSLYIFLRAGIFPCPDARFLP